MLNRDCLRRGRRNRLIGCTLMLNERAGQFQVRQSMQGDKAVENRRPNRLKNIPDLALKQYMCRQILAFFRVRCFNALKVQFHLNSFIQGGPSITPWRINVLHSLSKNYFPALPSFSLVWSIHVKLLKVNLALFES